MEARKRSKKYKIFWAIYWCASLIFLLMHRKTVLGTPAEGNHVAIFIALLTLLAFSAFFCTTRMFGKMTDENGHEIRMSFRPWHLIPFALNSIYAFLILEYVNNDEFSDMAPGYMALNVAGIFIITMIIFFWLNSFRRSLIFVLSFYTTMSIIFYAVYSMRGEPFQFIDVFSFGTAMQVAGNYSFSLTRHMVVTIVMTLCLMAIYLHLGDAQLARKGWKKILMRAGVLGFMFGMYFFYLNVNWNGGAGILTDLFAPSKTYKKYGTQVGFFCVAKYMRLTPPDNYSVKETEKIAEESESEEEPNTITSEKPVNIIAIMNESWADYRMIGDLQTNQEVMPYYDSLQENTIKGHTLVCIRGGGTAKTEYEFLTGNSVKRFPAMVPYVSYFTHDQYSLVTTLEAQGYDTAAMHPYKGSNWNRPTAYRLLNFNNYYTQDDFDDNTETIRGLISDQANYEKIVDLINNKKNADDPFFLFDVTIQNHGGYNNSFGGEITCTNYDDPQVNNYLSLIHESDKALQYLIEYFKNYDEPTLIVMFGDHYPSLPEGFETELAGGVSLDDQPLDKKEMYYATPFLIWANYDIPEEENVLTSTNYLGTMMLEQTGLEMAPYNYFLKNQMKTMPALNHLGYMDANGTFHSWSAAQSDAAQQEWKYECLQYNNLAEKKKRLDAFFTVTG